MTPPGKYGRPRKGDLTEEEFQEVASILSKPRKARGGSLQAAANRVSDMRGANNVMDPRTKQGRTVSARWISDQLTLRGIAGKTGLRGKVEAGQIILRSGENVSHSVHTGTRPGYAEPSENQAPILNAQVSEASSPVPGSNLNQRRPANDRP